MTQYGDDRDRELAEKVKSLREQIEEHQRNIQAQSDETTAFSPPPTDAEPRAGTPDGQDGAP